MSSFFGRTVAEIVPQLAPAPQGAESDAAAMAAVAQRINCKHTIDGATPEEMRVFAALAASHGSALYGITLMPSHAHHDACTYCIGERRFAPLTSHAPQGRTPSGVVYSLEGAGAITGSNGKGADIVPTSLGDGIAIVEVKSRDGSPLSDAYFLQRSAALATLPTGAEIDAGEPLDTSLDTPETLPVSLHAGSSRVTLHSGYRNNAVRYYLVVRAGAGGAAVQLAERARAGKYPTFSALAASADCRTAYDIASRRRRALLAHAAALLELDVATEIDKKSGQTLARPDKEQMTHQLVERKGLVGAHVTLYVNAYNTSDADGGVLLGVSPQRGYVWLHGAPWSNAAHNAFPSGTGRAAAYFSRAAPTASERKWASERVLDGSVNERTCDVYRQRSPKWIEVEAGLDRSPALGETQLTPVLVRMAPTGGAAAYAY